MASVGDIQASKVGPEVKRDYVHVSAPGGHRQFYQDLFAGLFDLEPAMGRIGPRLWLDLVRARHLLFATIDDDYAGFIAVALARSLIGRRTVGLFLRPSKCFESGRLVYRLKRWAFRCLRHLPHLSLFTILPFKFDRRFAEVAHGWVHDPQMWDMHDGAALIETSQLSRDVLTAAGGRAILCFLGSVRKSKGFEFLADIVSDHPDLAKDVFVVAVGRVDPACGDDCARLISAGGMVVDRFVSDDELLSLYKTCDFAWCCYEPDYDQASGIFGRSVQLGTRPIIRKGAYLEKYAQEGAVAPVCLVYGDTRDAAANIAAAAANRSDKPGRLGEIVGGWRADFVQKIRAAL
ncbi:hypothetical protein [Mesorhizobium sp.]|uniref:hypothetical protein n=1 Tax=Mesorhizobium sp. TaxID=1871066 RepID=UPI0011F9A1F5|nr:hypothetical protein [Mesorhizobium sp.]TIS63193.1 MAG: glycosyltransferase family 4 protein [Mesorhizobium sp.]